MAYTPYTPQPYVPKPYEPKPYAPPSYAPPPSPYAPTAPAGGARPGAATGYGAGTTPPRPRTADDIQADYIARNRAARPDAPSWMDDSYFRGGPMNPNTPTRQEWQQIYADEERKRQAATAQYRQSPEYLAAREQDRQNVEQAYGPGGLAAPSYSITAPTAKMVPRPTDPNFTSTRPMGGPSQPGPVVGGGAQSAAPSPQSMLDLLLPRFGVQPGGGRPY